MSGFLKKLDIHFVDTYQMGLILKNISFVISYKKLIFLSFFPHESVRMKGGRLDASLGCVIAAVYNHKLIFN